MNLLSLKSILEGCWQFLTGDLENGVILDIIDCHDMWFLTSVPNFSSLAWCLSRTFPNLEVHTWRMLMVPDWRLGGKGHPWHHGLSCFVILDLCAKFQLSSMIISTSWIPVLEVHTWRTVMVPDWILGGWGHPWHHESSWYVILDLCAKFQVSSIVRSVSGTSRTQRPYLEDIDGFWLWTWRMGSSFTSWIFIICGYWLVCQISAL